MLLTPLGKVPIFSFFALLALLDVAVGYIMPGQLSLYPQPLQLACFNNLENLLAGFSSGWILKGEGLLIIFFLAGCGEKINSFCGWKL